MHTCMHYHVDKYIHTQYLIYSCMKQNINNFNYPLHEWFCRLGKIIPLAEIGNFLKKSVFILQKFILQNISIFKNDQRYRNQ